MPCVSKKVQDYLSNAEVHLGLIYNICSYGVYSVVHIYWGLLLICFRSRSNN